MPGKVDSASPAAAMVRITDVGKFAPELRAHLDEIIRSTSFKGSHRSQNFLTHVVDHSLKGDTENLRERLIGMELFGRPADYDTGEDAIVRVTASDVRRRLLQFYGNAESGARFRIEIPSGAYLPQFRCFAEPEATAVVAEPEPEPAPAVEAPPAPAVERRVPRWIYLASGAVLLALVSGAIGWMLGKHPANRWLAPDDFISAAFNGPSRDVQVIISDEVLVLIQVVLDHRFNLSEYENRDYLNSPELQRDPSLQRLRGRLSSVDLANIGDLLNAARIEEVLHQRDWQVTIRHPRQVNARDFGSGNFILLGGASSNPWANLFRDQDSNFPNIEEPHPNPTGKNGYYLNRHPLPGEPDRFELGRTREGKQITHARVALMENGSRVGRVLWVAGQSAAATEMAGEFLLSPESIDKTRRMLGISGSGPLPDLEMMLRVTEASQVGSSVQLEACRKLVRHSD